MDIRIIEKTKGGGKMAKQVSLTEKPNDSSQDHYDEMRQFVARELEAIQSQRKGLRSEADVLRKQIEFGMFFASGDCCTSTTNT